MMYNLFTHLDIIVIFYSLGGWGDSEKGGFEPPGV